MKLFIQTFKTKQILGKKNYLKLNVKEKKEALSTYDSYLQPLVGSS